MSNLRHHIILQLTVFVWGYTGILGNLISLHYEHLVWFRMLLAFGAFAVMMFFFKPDYKIPAQRYAVLFLTGSVIAAHWVFFYGAIKISTVSIAVVCLATQSVFVSLLQPLFLRTAFIWYELLLGLIAWLGIGLIFGIETEHTDGIIMGLAASLFGAIFTMLNSRYVQQVSPVLISSVEMLGGFLFLSLYLLLINGFHEEWFTVSGWDWFFLLLLSIGCTAIPFPVSVYLMKKLTPFTVSISLNLEPIYTIVLALFIFGDAEHMSTGFYLGALIIFGTVIANAYIKMKSRKKLPDHIEA